MYIEDADTWLTKIIKEKLDAGSDRSYAEAVDSEVEAESMRDFGYSRGPCAARSVQR